MLRVLFRLVVYGFALVGVLATVALISSMSTHSGCSRCLVARARITQLESALELYREDNGIFPTTQQGLAALVVPPSIAPAPPAYNPGGYLADSRVPVDPWGSEFYYRSPGIERPDAFDLWSLGADGALGGAGPDADVTNWQSESTRRE